ncbi:MAG TPA: twin-arginine translocation signal domain-containing protein [Gammaproteobacteria bacterium]
MPNRDESKQSARRDFLRKVAVAGGSVAVVAAAGKTIAAPAEPETQKPSRDAVGYRETDHVRAYYRTCRN